MAETRMDKGNAQESDQKNLPSDSRRIQEIQSDDFVARLKEVIGDKKTTWFATESGVGESTLRNILSGAWPRTDILVAIANAAGVTVDWLATGRLPKTRAEQRRFVSGDEAKSKLNDLPPLLAAKVGMAVGMSDILADIPAKDRQIYLVVAAELILDLSSGDPRLQERLTEEQETLEAAIRIAKTIVGQRARDGLGATRKTASAK